MKNLFEKVQQTIKDIQLHPDVVVEELSYGDPVTPEFIETFESVSGLGLPTIIKEFYASANGIIFSWKVKPDLPEERIAKIRSKIGDPGYDLKKPLGALKILPLQDMLLNTKWNPAAQYGGDDAGEVFEFGSQMYSKGSFVAMIRLFDMYYLDNDAEAMAFVVHPSSPEYKYELIMLDNYLADSRNSFITDFQTYIRAICATSFVIPARRTLFEKYRGDKEAQLTYEKIDPAKLSSVLF